MAVTRAQAGLGSSPRYPLRTRTGPSKRQGRTPTIGQDQKPEEDAPAGEENTGRTKRARRGKKEPTRTPDADTKDDTVALVSDQQDEDNPMFDVRSEPIVLESEHHEETGDTPEDTNVQTNSSGSDEAGKSKLVSDERLPDVRGHVEQQGGSKKRKRAEEATHPAAMIQADANCLNTVNEMMGYLAARRFDMYHLCTLQLLTEVDNREEFKNGLPSLTKEVLKDLMDDMDPINGSEEPGKVYMGFPNRSTEEERDRCWKQWRKLYTGLGKAMDELELSRHPTSKDLDAQQIPESLSGLNETDCTALLRKTFAVRAKAYNQDMRMHEKYIRQEKDWVDGILKTIYEKKQQAYDIRVTANTHAEKENRGHEPQAESNEVRDMEDLRSQINKLQADIKTKDEGLKRLQEAGQEDDPRAQLLTEQLKAAREETSKLQSEVTEAKNEINEAARSKKELEAKIKKHEMLSSEKGEKIRKLEAEAINNQNENKMLQLKVDSNKHLSDEIKEQAKKINRLESQLRIKEDEIAEKNKDMMNKDKDHEILERELNEQLKHEKQKIEELKMDLDQAGSATSKMKAKTSELEHQIQLLRMEKEGVDESSGELLSGLRCQIDELESQVDDLKSQLRNTQEKSSQHSSETSRLEERVRVLTDDVERKDNEIENQRSEIEKRGKTINQYREEENRLRSDMRELRQSLNEKARDLEKKVDESRRKADELEETKVELKATKLTLEERDKRDKEKNTQLEDREKSDREIKIKLGQVEKELEKQKVKLEIEERERKKHEDKLEEKSKELQEKKTELEEKETELEKKSREMRQKQDTIEILQGKLKDMESRATNATQGSARKAEQLEKRLEELTSKSVSLENDLTKAKSDERTMEAQRKEIDSLKDDRDRAREEMREKSKEYNELKAALERPKEALMSVLADAEIQAIYGLSATQPAVDLPSLLSQVVHNFKEGKRTIEEREKMMKKEREGWLQEKEHLKATIHGHDTRKDVTVQELERQMKERQAENESLRKELENLKRENLDTSERVTFLWDDLEGTESELEIAKARNGKVQDDHKKELALQKESYERALEQQKESHEMALAIEKEGYKRALENIQDYDKALQASLTESKNQAEKTKQDYESRIQQLQRQLDEAYATRDRIHKQLADKGPVGDIINPETITSRPDGARRDAESYGTSLFGQVQRLDQLNNNRRETTTQAEESSTMEVDGNIPLLESVDQSSNKANIRLGTHGMGGEIEANIFAEPESQPLWGSKPDGEMNWSNYPTQRNQHPFTKGTNIMRRHVMEDVRAGTRLSPHREVNMNATTRELGELQHAGKADTTGTNLGKEGNEARRNSTQFPLVAQSSEPEPHYTSPAVSSQGTGPRESTNKNQKRGLLPTSTAVQNLVAQAASHNSAQKEHAVREGETSHPETGALHKPYNKLLEYGDFGFNPVELEHLIHLALGELLRFTPGGDGGSRPILASSQDYCAPDRKLPDFVSEKTKESHGCIEVQTLNNLRRTNADTDQSEPSSKGVTKTAKSSIGRKRTPPVEEEPDTVESPPTERLRPRVKKDSRQGNKPHRQPARREARQTIDKYEIKITYKSKTELFSVQSIQKSEASTTYKVELYNKSSHVRYNIPLLQLLAIGTKDTAATNTLTLRRFCQNKDIVLHDALAVSEIKRIANKNRSFNVTFGHANSSEDDGSPEERVLQASSLFPWGYHIAEMMGGEFVKDFEEAKESYIHKGLGKLDMRSVHFS